MAILFGLGFFCLSLLFSLFERRSNIIVALTSFGILMIIFCFSYHNADYIIIAVLSNELTSRKSQKEPYCSIIWLTLDANITDIER